VARQDPWLRKFYSRGYNLLARTLLGTTVRDIDCALKVFRRDALLRLLPATDGFFVNTEMLTRARQLGLAVVETGVRHRPRLRGESKVSFRDIPRTLNALLPFWWSRVMFAGECRSDAPQPAVRWGCMLALALMACVLFLARLQHPLLEPEEARYAEIPRQMLAQERFVTPVLHGEDYYQKPPLLYWLVMGCYSVFGVHDWAARLVPALAGVLTVMLTAAWGWRALGFWTGLVSGAILALSARFLYMAGMLSMDGLLCLWVIAGLAAGHLALRSGSRMLWLVSAAACGLGVLTKGPVAIVLIATPLLALGFLDRSCLAPRARGWLAYVLLIGLIAGPWFVAVAWQAPQASGEFFWLHHVLRYFAPSDHEKPAWFYLPSVILGTLPWSLLLVPLAPYLVRRSLRAGRRRPAPLGFMLLAVLWCVVFFSLSGCKRPGYVLPAFPLLALLIATYVTHGLPWPRWVALPVPGYAQRLGHRVAQRLGEVALTLGVLGGWGAVLGGLWSAAEAGVATLLLAVATVVVRRVEVGRAAWRSWATCAAMVFVLLLGGMQLLLPGYHDHFGLRSQIVPQMDHLAGPVACYPKRWDSVSFYLQREVETVAPGEERDLIKDLGPQGQRLLFVKGQALPELLKTLPAGWEFVQRGAPGPNVVVGMVRKKN
jgi:4-amino-4-deoxy-L-arabinose transferase-like glycosyltransferase